MSCTGCSNDTGTGTGASTGKAGNAFDAAFGRFWPAGLPGPRLLPWLGAAVSREEARAWALAIGADRDPRVLAGDEQAMLHLIGQAMAGGGVYAEERKGRKKEKEPSYRETTACRCTSYVNGRAYVATAECSGTSPHCCCGGEGPDVRAWCSPQPCPEWDRGGGLPGEPIESAFSLQGGV